MKLEQIKQADPTATYEVSIPRQLPPLLSQEVHQLMKSPETLVSLVAKHGSPLHICWPHKLKENAQAMQNAITQFGVKHRIYYGMKNNLSHAFVQQAAEGELGIDVASEHELDEALAAGVPGYLVHATGPVKSQTFIEKLALHDSTISIDSLAEMHQIIQYSKSLHLNNPINVTLRVRFDYPSPSRFGLSRNELSTALSVIAEESSLLNLIGFHFHLSGYDVQTRVRAIKDCIVFLDEAKVLGLTPSVINIGGGLPIQYVEAEAFEDFCYSHCDSDYQNQHKVTQYYPYGGMSFIPWLESLLHYRLNHQSTIAEYLVANDFTLALEPGRALVDQAAISVFQVQHCKSVSDHHVLFVNGSSFSACETWFNSEYLVNPIHLQTQTLKPSPAGRAFIAGHSCLGEDVLTHRLVPFERLPQTGDLLVFANTAGYQMDLLQNRFHRYPLPQKINAGADNQMFHQDEEVSV